MDPSFGLLLFIPKPLLKGEPPNEKVLQSALRDYGDVRVEETATEFRVYFRSYWVDQG